MLQHDEWSTKYMNLATEGVVILICFPIGLLCFPFAIFGYLNRKFKWVDVG